MYSSPVSKDLNLPSAAAGVRTPPQMSSPGLLRYRSAPSTLLGEVCGDFLPAGGGGGGGGGGVGQQLQLQRLASPPDHSADTVLARFLSGHGSGEIRDKPPRPAHFVPEDAAAAAAAMASQQQQQQQQLMYQSHQHHQQQQQQMASTMEGLYRTVSSGRAAHPPASSTI